MSRPKKKPNYDPEQVMAELMDTVVSCYNVKPRPSLQAISDELDLNPIKVRKILITAGVYESGIAENRGGSRSTDGGRRGTAGCSCGHSGGYGNCRD